MSVAVDLWKMFSLAIVVKVLSDCMYPYVHQRYENEGALENDEGTSYNIAAKRTS